ncbi:unnamed protein product [Rotaria sordida]|uniref:Uncharacterized protein n=1 Tax=Rotaria sordida TaxID=392033 RepID=A0A814ZVR3_9BILA|nr:unnamed protein product [Rotaria sordida]
MVNDGYRIIIDKTTTVEALNMKKDDDTLRIVYTKTMELFLVPIVDNKEYTALSELNVHLNPQHSTNSSPVEIMAIDTFVIKAMMTIMELNEYYEEKKS